MTVAYIRQMIRSISMNVKMPVRERILPPRCRLNVDDTDKSVGVMKLTIILTSSFKNTKTKKKSLF